MFLIVIHHAIVHGLGLRGLASADATEVAIRSGDMALFCLANGFCIVAVNAFVLISGYFRHTALEKEGARAPCWRCFSIRCSSPRVTT